MPQLVKIDDAFWHDGQILSLSVQFDSSGNGVLEMRLSLLGSLNSQDRFGFLIVAKGPERIFATMDVTLMKTNFKFGNIANAKFYDGVNKKMLIVLAEGYIEISGPTIDFYSME
jgi:hypothetical protein